MSIIVCDEMESIQSVIKLINNDSNCLFLAYMSNNLHYISINAFIHKLHDELGYSDFSGIVINLRNDPNYGHSFANDSYRFPEYVDVRVVHITDDGLSSTRKESITRIGCFLKNNLLSRRKTPLYLISASPEIRLVSKLIAETDRSVIHVLISSGATYAVRHIWLKRTLKAFFWRGLERIIVKQICFTTFSDSIGMKRNRNVEKYCRMATEDEQLDLMGNNENEKYVLYVSQDKVYKKYNDIVKKVLDKELRKGYAVYVKPHSHERVPCYPQNSEYNILPISYGVESLVGGAKRRPDKIIGIASTSLFTCSSWFEVPCYTLINLVPDEEVSDSNKVFMRLIEGGEYPDIHFYEEDLD